MKNRDSASRHTEKPPSHGIDNIFIDNTPFPIILVDADQKILEHNKNAYQLFPNLTEQLFFYELFKQTKKDFHQNFVSYIDRLQTAQMELKAGEEIYLVYGFRIENLDSKNKISYQYILQNISLLRQYQYKMQKMIEKEANAKIKQQEELLHIALLENNSTLLRSISHHWRNPLNHIALNAEEAIELATDEKQKGFLENILVNIYNLSTIITSFIEYYRPHESTTRFELVSLIKDMHLIFNTIRGDYEIKCSCNLNTDPIYIETYKSALRNIVMAFFNNAIDSIQRVMKNGIVREHTIGFSFLLEDDSVSIILRDSGEGFSESALKKLYLPYSSETKLTKNAGLNLYMAKVIIERHMLGSLEIQNLQNFGAEVCIKLPLSVKGEKFP